MRKNVQIIVVFALCCTLATAQAGTTRRIVGYYYGKGRPGYQLSQVSVQELTHLIYSLAKPTARGDCEMAHPDVDMPNLLAPERLRAGNPRLLVLVSVGGWGGAACVSDVADTASAIGQFFASCLPMGGKDGLNGLGID